MKRDQLYNNGGWGNQDYGRQPLPEHRDRRYLDSYDRQPVSHHRYHQQDHRELTNTEVKRLLEETKQHLPHVSLAPEMRQEFTASCWQLCGLSCAKNDSACIMETCDSLCQPAGSNRLIPTSNTYRAATMDQPEVHSFSSLPRERHRGFLPEDFMEEEKVLQSRRDREQTGLQLQRSNDILGEAFADQQATLEQTLEGTIAATQQMSNNSQPQQALPPTPDAQSFKMPSYAFPLIGGFSIILVFCTMIGFLILEPNSAERKKRRQRQQQYKVNQLRKVASKTWTTQPERLENRMMSSSEQRHLGESVYKRL